MDKTSLTSNLILKSLLEGNVEKVERYLSISQKLTDSLNYNNLLYFQDILKVDGSYEEKHQRVSCVLSWLQHFLDSADMDLSMWEQCALPISIFCRRVYSLSATVLVDDSITERSINIILDIIKRSPRLANNVLLNMLETVVDAVCDALVHGPNLLLSLNLLNELLRRSSYETCWEKLPVVTYSVVELSFQLLECGDFETQVSIVEFLARSWKRINPDYRAPLFTTCLAIFKHFDTSKSVNFDTESRLFLNQVNSSLKDRQLVYSLPCMVVIADGVTLEKPLDPLYKEFWVDFNTTSRSISLYYVVSGEEKCSLMKIEEKNVLYILAKNSICNLPEKGQIPAVKMKILMKVYPPKPDLPNVLEICPGKTREFANVEKNFISKIFKDKYKSEVSYTDLSFEGENSQPSPESNETTVTITDTENDQINLLVQMIISKSIPWP